MQNSANTDRVPFNDLGRMSAEVRSSVEGAIADVVASGWFVLGPQHDAFEKELGAYLGVSDVVLLGNGTDALELGLAALGVGPGDGVLTVANAGAYSSIAARLLRATPVYADVDPNTLLVTAETIRLALDGTNVPIKVIVITHLYGAMVPMEEIVGLARERGIPVLEDCAQSIGARSGGRQSGTFGDIATTSFYPTKNLGALGDGGAVFTNNPDLAASVRRMRQYGWASKYHIAYDHGRNSRMDELQAAILRVKLPHLDRLNDRRREIHARYQSCSSAAARVVNSASESFTAHLAVLVAVDRDGFRSAMTAAGVGTDVHYPIPDHLQDFPSAKPTGFSLPATEYAAGAVVSVPMFPELTDAEVERVCAVLNEYGRTHG